MTNINFIKDQNRAGNYQPVFFSNEKMLTLWKIYHQSTGKPQDLAKFFSVIIQEAEAVIARKIGMKNKNYLKRTSKAIKRIEREQAGKQQTTIKKLAS